MGGLLDPSPHGGIQEDPEYKYMYTTCIRTVYPYITVTVTVSPFQFTKQYPFFLFYRVSQLQLLNTDSLFLFTALSDTLSHREENLNSLYKLGAVPRGNATKENIQKMGFQEGQVSSTSVAHPDTASPIWIIWLDP